eukprot:scaffold946_cov415-Prasinococcus_capsulatus_cf.AAC.8
MHVVSAAPPYWSEKETLQVATHGRSSKLRGARALQRAAPRCTAPPRRVSPFWVRAADVGADQPVEEQRVRGEPPAVNCSTVNVSRLVPFFWSGVAPCVCRSSYGKPNPSPDPNRNSG